uniref:Uncharacterized protein n=1 Tax=Arundo donax TaxID=35708 RepID=A0A0A9C0R0_ARUDO
MDRKLYITIFWFTQMPVLASGVEPDITWFAILGMLSILSPSMVTIPGQIFLVARYNARALT